MGGRATDLRDRPTTQSRRQLADTTWGASLPPDTTRSAAGHRWWHTVARVRGRGSCGESADGEGADGGRRRERASSGGWGVKTHGREASL